LEEQKKDFEKERPVNTKNLKKEANARKVVVVARVVKRNLNVVAENKYNVNFYINLYYRNVT